MAETVGELLVRIRADVSQLEAGLKTAERGVNSFGNVGSQATRTTGRLENALRGLGVSAAGIPGPMGRVANALLSFAPGGLAMAGALAGIGALVIAWQIVTDRAQKAREEMQRTIDALGVLKQARLERVSGLIQGARDIDQLGTLGGVTFPIGGAAPGLVKLLEQRKQIVAELRQLQARLDPAATIKLGAEEARAAFQEFQNLQGALEVVDRQVRVVGGQFQGTFELAVEGAMRLARELSGLGETILPQLTTSTDKFNEAMARSRAAPSVTAARNLPFLIDNMFGPDVKAQFQQRVADIEGAFRSTSSALEEARERLGELQLAQEDLNRRYNEGAIDAWAFADATKLVQEAMYRATRDFQLAAASLIEMGGQLIASVMRAFRSGNLLNIFSSLTRAIGTALMFVNPVAGAIVIGGGEIITAGLEPQSQSRVASQPASAALTIDVSGMPPAANPLAAARDRDWQRFLRESASLARGAGYRFT